MIKGTARGPMPQGRRASLSWCSTGRPPSARAAASHTASLTGDAVADVVLSITEQSFCAIRKP